MAEGTYAPRHSSAGKAKLGVKALEPTGGKPLPASYSAASATSKLRGHKATINLFPAKRIAFNLTVPKEVILV